MTRKSSDPSGAPATPRWVKLSAVFAVVVVVLVVVVLLVGGNHGPGRHTGSGSDAGNAAPNAAPEGHRPPEGGHQPP